MLLVSNYHYIREDFSAPYPSIFGLTPAQFKNQLETFSRYGSFISQEDLLENPEKIIQGNYFLITFDDGLKEQFELARPILQNMGIPYIFFINTSNYTERQVSLVHKIHLLRSQIAPKLLIADLDQKELDSMEKKAAIEHYNYDTKDNAILKYILNFKFSLKEQLAFIDPLFTDNFEEAKIARDLYFTDSMLKQLASEGVLASHSHTHRPLGLLNSRETQEELQLTQDFFLELTGNRTKTISYPYGSFDSCKGLDNVLKENGFKIGFSMERAANKSVKDHSLLLARFDCNDLPGGKNDLFEGQNPFRIAKNRKWHTYENRASNQ